MGLDDFEADRGLCSARTLGGSGKQRARGFGSHPHRDHGASRLSRLLRWGEQRLYPPLATLNAVGHVAAQRHPDRCAAAHAASAVPVWLPIWLTEVCHTLRRPATLDDMPD